VEETKEKKKLRKFGKEMMRKGVSRRRKLKRRRKLRVRKGKR
jgi:hypothetical protein